MYCRFCGKEIEDGTVYCQYCGANLAGDRVSDVKKPSSFCRTSIIIVVLSLAIIAIAIFFAVHPFGTSGQGDDNSPSEETRAAAYSSFLTVLEESETSINDYMTWAYSDSAPCALYDVTGDGLEELFLVSTPPGMLDGRLIVYTYNEIDDESDVILNASIYTGGLGGTMLNVFSSDDGDITVFSLSSEEGGYFSNYSRYCYNGTEYTAEYEMTESIVNSFSSDGLTVLDPVYTVNGTEVNETEFRSSESGMLDSVGTLLISIDSSDDRWFLDTDPIDSAVSNYEPISEPYEDMHALLSSNAPEGSSVSETIPEYLTADETQTDSREYDSSASGIIGIIEESGSRMFDAARWGVIADSYGVYIFTYEDWYGVHLMNVASSDNYRSFATLENEVGNLVNWGCTTIVLSISNYDDAYGDYPELLEAAYPNVQFVYDYAPEDGRVFYKIFPFDYCYPDLSTVNGIYNFTSLGLFAFDDNADTSCEYMAEEFEGFNNHLIDYASGSAYYWDFTPLNVLGIDCNEMCINYDVNTQKIYRVDFYLQGTHGNTHIPEENAKRAFAELINSLSAMFGDCIGEWNGSVFGSTPIGDIRIELVNSINESGTYNDCVISFSIPDRMRAW